jgi:hypothetical protein
MSSGGEFAARDSIQTNKPTDLVIVSPTYACKYTGSVRTSENSCQFDRPERAVTNSCSSGRR